MIMEVVSIIANPPTTWEVTTLGKVCEEGGGDIQTGPFGSQLHASDYVNDGIPSVMPVNIGDSRILTDGICRITEADAQRLSRYRLRAGDIVYSRRGDVERLALVRDKEDGWLCGTGCLRARFGKNKVNPLYASYYLGHPSVRQWVVQHAIGATMPNLNTGILSALPFLCPPLPVQHRIADILGSLDDKIELNRRTNETLETMARTIYKSWFVDFDPVVAKSEGRQPEGMDAETAKLFPSSFEDSEIGRVPKGWKVKPFSHTVDILSGGTPKTTVNDYWGGEIPWFSVVDTPSASDVFVMTTEKTITQAGVDGSATQVLPSGTTIITARGTVGKTCIVGVPMAMNQSCFGLCGKSRNSGQFTYYSTRFLVSTLQNHAHGSVFATITRSTFDGVNAIEPPRDLVIAFEDATEAIFCRIRSNLQEIHLLTVARDALLPRLLSGELVVPARMTA